MRLFRDIWDFWKETWETNKILFWVEGAGSICGMIAAVIMTFGAPQPNLLVAFTFYLIGGFCLAWASYVRKFSWMVALMTFYSITTVVGLVNLFV